MNMADERPIYLDYNATTPCDPRVLEAMRPYFTDEFGNPASRTHAYGWRSEEAVERARTQIAQSIGARPRELIFTSGATEANNLALLGAARATAKCRGRVVVCRTEHRSVLDPCQALRREGFDVTQIAVQPSGQIDISALRKALRRGALLVSVMHANNEIGILQPLQEISAAAHASGALVHTDAAQSVGKVAVDVASLGVDLLSLSGHKLYGPKGIGALYVRDRRPSIELRPILYGGGHERGLRSGTLPAPLCVGLGRACEIAVEELEVEAVRTRRLRDRLLSNLEARIDDLQLNGDPEDRLPGNLNLSFRGIEASSLLLALPDVAISAGSACTSAHPEPSHVLAALGLPPEEVLSSVRIGIGRFTTDEEVDRAAVRIAEEVGRLRALSPVWDAARRSRAPRAAARRSENR
jgi:cysteine desulfurase